MINVLILFTCLWSRSRYGPHGGTGITFSLGQYGVFKSICDRKYTLCLQGETVIRQPVQSEFLYQSPLQLVVPLKTRELGSNSYKRGDMWPAQMSEKTAAFHRKTVSLRRTANSQLNQTEILVLIKENDCWVNSAVFYFTTASLHIFNIFSLQHFK